VDVIKPKQMPEVVLDVCYVATRARCSNGGVCRYEAAGLVRCISCAVYCQESGIAIAVSTQVELWWDIVIAIIAIVLNGQ
jgi:hypothetical protein